MNKLNAKVAIVTGGAQGIGRGIVEAYVRAGAAVLLADINGAAIDRAVAELDAIQPGRVLGRVVDVTDREQVQDMVARPSFRAAGHLVNNAWKGGPLARLEQQSDEQLRGAFDMAVMAAFWAMQAALPEFRRLGGGRVINLCSLNGVNAHMYSADYNAAKEALRSLTRTAAREWARDQICCNIICPGAARRPTAASPERASPGQPMHRRPPEDIGPVAVFSAAMIAAMSATPSSSMAGAYQRCALLPLPS